MSESLKTERHLRTIPIFWDILFDRWRKWYSKVSLESIWIPRSLTFLDSWITDPFKIRGGWCNCRFLARLSINEWLTRDFGLGSAKYSKAVSLNHRVTGYSGLISEIYLNQWEYSPSISDTILDFQDIERYGWTISLISIVSYAEFWLKSNQIFFASSRISGHFLLKSNIVHRRFWFNF